MLITTSHATTSVVPSKGKKYVVIHCVNNNTFMSGLKTRGDAEDLACDTARIRENESFFSNHYEWIRK